jgi:hypothetical protein
MSLIFVVGVEEQLAAKVVSTPLARAKAGARKKETKRYAIENKLDK